MRTSLRASVCVPWLQHVCISVLFLCLPMTVCDDVSALCQEVRLCVHLPGCDSVQAFVCLSICVCWYACVCVCARACASVRLVFVSLCACTLWHVCAPVGEACAGLSLCVHEDACERAPLSSPPSLFLVLFSLSPKDLWKKSQGGGGGWGEGPQLRVSLPSELLWTQRGQHFHFPGCKSLS